MARAVEAHYGAPLEGVVVVPYGHGVACEHIRVVEAAHPVPDGAAEDAARLLLDTVGGLSPDDLVIALMAGGGSAMIAFSRRAPPFPKSMRSAGRCP